MILKINLFMYLLNEFEFSINFYEEQKARLTVFQNN